MVSLSARALASQQVVARRGEEPPNPMVMERFQSVISSLFQQARSKAAVASRELGAARLRPKPSRPRACSLVHAPRRATHVSALC